MDLTKEEMATVQRFGFDRPPTAEELLLKATAERDALADTLQRVRGWADPNYAPGFTAENRLAEIADALDSAPPVARPRPARDVIYAAIRARLEGASLHWTIDTPEMHLAVADAVLAAIEKGGESA